MKTYRLNLMDL